MSSGHHVKLMVKSKEKRERGKERREGGISCWISWIPGPPPGEGRVPRGVGGKPHLGARAPPSGLRCTTPHFVALAGFAIAGTPGYPLNTADITIRFLPAVEAYLKDISMVSVSHRRRRWNPVTFPTYRIDRAGAARNLPNPTGLNKQGLPMTFPTCLPESLRQVTPTPLPAIGRNRKYCEWRKIRGGGRLLGSESHKANDCKSVTHK